ncbi:hypothetical protein BH09MYX1_BH09MYX1_45200 [soil metagenome]
MLPVPPVALVDSFGLIGQLLDGQFRVDEAIGEGGFSIVYRGHHMGLDVPVAIKCLKLPQGLPSAVIDSFVNRFREESRLLYRLSQGNLNIVRSIASGTLVAQASNAMVPYMVLEWLDGISLDGDIEARRAAGLPGRALADAIELLRPAAEALTYAHEQGVAHRDLNPGNVFLARGPDGIVRTKILDFGLAKVIGETIEKPRRAQSFAHVRVFSPTHAAPEQFDASLGVVGVVSDVYSFALLVSETILGNQTIEGETMSEIQLKVFDPNVKRSPGALGANVSTHVEEIFTKALAIDPTRRHADAAAFWEALLRAAGRSSALEVVVMPSSSKAPAPPSVKSERGQTLRLPPSTPPPPSTSTPPSAAQKQTVRMATPAPPPTSMPPRDVTAPMRSARQNMTVRMPTAPAPDAVDVRRIARPATSNGTDVVPEQPLVELEPGVPTVTGGATDPARNKQTFVLRRDDADDSPEILRGKSGPPRWVICVALFVLSFLVGAFAIVIAQGSP